MLTFAAALTAFALVGIAAAAPPAGVTIAAAKPAVVFGGTVKLYGTVSNHQSGEHVVVLGRPFGVTTFTEVDAVTTGAKGAWSYMAMPQIQTAYEASWNAVNSSRSVTIKVRPRIRLSLVSRTVTRGTFSVQVDGNRPFTGKYVLVQRLTPNGPATVKHATLDSSSSATFTIRLPRHRARVRVVMPTSQAAPGYIAGYSNVWKSS